MSIFLDASAMVAITTNEPGAFALEARFGADEQRLYSAITLWEAARAVARKRTVTLAEASAELQAFLSDFACRLVPIGAPEAEAAIVAQDRYGKGTRDPAGLNMGDCFAYACAKTNNARLLYKGDDFTHTDLA